MGAAEVTRFLTSLATDAKVAASTQNQVLNALLFLYRVVLEQNLPGLDEVVPARLRVKDVDFAANQIVVRRAKGARGRVTMLPAAAKPALIRHLQSVRRPHDDDVRRGAGWVEMPDALARKYPNAGREWAGSGSSPPRGSTRIATAASAGATTCTSRCSSAPSGTRFAPPASPSPRAGPPRRGDNHDLYPRPEPWSRRCPQPGRPPARLMTSPALPSVRSQPIPVAPHPTMRAHPSMVREDSPAEDGINRLATLQQERSFACHTEPLNER